MKWLLPIIGAAALTSLSAGQAKIVPDEVLDRIRAESPIPQLPASMTPAERRIPIEVPDPTRLTPPTGDVYTPSEYDPNEGMLIVWNHYNSMLTAMVVPITTNDEETMVYVVVSGPSEQSSATSTLSGAGADMDQVEFITYVTDTGWIRDYGPRFIFEDGARGIVDHTYNRPRPHDDAFPGFLSDLWGEAYYKMPVVHGGGNFHLFSNGDAFMSTLILEENPGLTEEDVIQIIADYKGCNLTIYEGFPYSIDGTRHIDMWMLPIGDYKVIIGEYDESGSYPPEEITEYAVADLEARGYTVYRTPGWNSGSGGYYGTHYTYTNATILNDLVFIPEFGGSYTAQDAQAEAIFQDAMPGYQIIPVDCSSIIHSAGAMHCSMMHVPAYTAGMQVTPGGGFFPSGPVGGPFDPDSIVYTVSNLGDDPIEYEVTYTADWLTIDDAIGTIPVGDVVDVTVSLNDAAGTLPLGEYDDLLEFTNLTNHDGDTSRVVTLTVGVPVPIHSFPMDDDPGWTMTGEWDFGKPTGGGGAHGYPDPTCGATGDNVCGVNLNGDYSTGVGGPYYLTAGPIDCSDIAKAELHFQRWLNSDYQPYVSATLHASTDGSDWNLLWQNGGSEIAENSWNEHVYDISAVADGQETVYIRWGHSVDQSGAYAYSGWNIDDVAIWGLPTGACPADITGDGVVDVLDLLEVLAQWGTSGGPADITGDGVVDVLDLLEVLAAWGPC